MSTFAIKLIAIVTMLMDHTAATIVTNPTLYEIMRGIGRVSFPLFAFLLVEGYFHTSNIYKYIGRMLLFAVVSEFPYDLAFYHTVFSFEMQNIFYTLALGLMVMHLITLILNRWGFEDIRSTILMALVMMASFVIATVLRFDYMAGGILTILLFYFFRQKKVVQAVGLLVINGYLYSARIQIFATAAIIFLWFYNGKQGKRLKYFFYLFYPIHLFLLFLLEAYVFS